MPAEISTSEEVDIDVCICTFRRTSLTDTVRSLARQQGFQGRVRIIIADNDEVPSASDQADELRTTGLDILYVHAPARNISIARNACLAAATAQLVAFIDDDEVADPYWLSSLTEALSDTHLSAVFGPVQAVYDANAPKWIKDADLHSATPVVTARGVDTGYTSNALVRRNAIGSLQFDVALGRSGGEDTDLFTRMYAQGHRFGVAPDAIVRERVVDSRMTLEWLTERAFRSGQTHAKRFISSPSERLRGAAVALAKASACATMALGKIGSPSGWRREVVRTSLHLGVTARLLGIRDRQIYG